jgi:hypothetical protein
VSNAGTAFRTYLLTKSGVTDLLGSTGAIYPDRLPQSHTLPAIVYYTISEVPEHHMTGASPLTMYRLQLDCYAATRVAADGLAEATRDAADGYRGTMGSEYVQTCHLDSSRSDADDPRDASDSYRYIKQQDWILALTETAPSL